MAEVTQPALALAQPLGDGAWNGGVTTCAWQAVATQAAAQPPAAASQAAAGGEAPGLSPLEVPPHHRQHRRRHRRRRRRRRRRGERGDDASCVCFVRARGCAAAPPVQAATPAATQGVTPPPTARAHRRRVPAHWQPTGEMAPAAASVLGLHGVHSGAEWRSAPAVARRRLALRRLCLRRPSGSRRVRWR